MTTPATPRRDGETLDTFYRGRVRVLQKKKGYRFSVDAPLLADFIRTGPEDEALELGTGSGIISLLLSVKPFRRITALEIQAGLADLARRNVELNGLEDRIEIVRGGPADLRAGADVRPHLLQSALHPEIDGIPERVGREVRGQARAPRRHRGRSSRRRPSGSRRKAEPRFVYPEKRRVDFSRAADAQGFRVLRFRHVLPREVGAGQPLSRGIGIRDGPSRDHAPAYPLRPRRQVHGSRRSRLLRPVNRRRKRRSASLPPPFPPKSGPSPFQPIPVPGSLGEEVHGRRNAVPTMCPGDGTVKGLPHLVSSCLF